MRCLIVLCVASMVGVSAANHYGGQQMPVSYYLPSSMNPGMYAGRQKMYVPGHQQMYVPQYYQPQVAAAYPVRQMPAYQVRPMVVSPQVEEVPVINVAMDFSPTLTYPGAVYGDSTQSFFDSRSGSVSSSDSNIFVPAQTLNQEFGNDNDGLITGVEAEHLAFNETELVEMETGNPGFKETNICENEGPAIVSCGSYKILITAANYGRQNPGSQICPRKGADKNINCIGGRKKVEDECNGKNSCTLPPTNKFFGDPCRGTYKYVFVRWVCL